MKDLFGNKLESSAEFTPDRKHRYTLTRRWDAGPTCNFIMLNPSTADEIKEDPTIRRCIDFAGREKCGSLIVTNIYAWRSTNPAVLWREPNPIGFENDKWLLEIATSCELVICAWGSHGSKPAPLHQVPRGDQVKAMLRKAGVKLWCLGLNADGTPEHPLYIAKDRPLREFV